MTDITKNRTLTESNNTPADILFQGGRIINVNLQSIDHINVGILGNHLVVGATDGKEIIDLDGAYISPGFIDAHMHVESTMLPPSTFSNLSVPHGTTAVVLDPHEIANVMGIAGIKLIMNDATEAPIDCFFTASSCVPASKLETSGATLLTDDLEPLFKDDRVIGLAEMMNFPGVLADDAEVHRKIQMGLRHGFVDGHCPQLRGKDLLKYVGTGISSDHESINADEAREKLEAGLQIYIREGSAARNLEALLPIITPQNAHRICFCTDDRHPADLKEDGHIDNIVRLAIKWGLDPLLAICIATKHPADHFRLKKHGVIETGRLANLVIFDELDSPQIKQTWHRGRLVAQNGKMVTPSASTIDWSSARNSIHLTNELTTDSLQISNSSGDIRVIGLVKGQLYTEELHCDACVKDNNLIADPKNDILKLAVIERHQMTGNIGLGFVQGFQFRDGAIASTVGHDAHNIAVVGDNDDDMCVAANALADAGGGQCVVSNGNILAILPLPLAGLMSDAEPDCVIAQQKKVLDCVSKLGCTIDDPFMPLSFLPLSVIPKLKLTDLGLIDVEQFKVVSLQIGDKK
ncbi:MAG: adenine deaminase [Planctomycetota bacterium]|nr:adenine deaminase [Planctomycetota bacterium]